LALAPESLRAAEEAAALAADELQQVKQAADTVQQQLQTQLVEREAELTARAATLHKLQQTQLSENQEAQLIGNAAPIAALKGQCQHLETAKVNSP